MRVRYNGFTFASIDEDCFGEDNIEDIEFLLKILESNRVLESYTVTHYLYGGTEVGTDDEYEDTIYRIAHESKFEPFPVLELLEDNQLDDGSKRCVDCTTISPNRANFCIECGARL